MMKAAVTPASIGLWLGCANSKGGGKMKKPASRFFASNTIVCLDADLMDQPRLRSSSLADLPTASGAFVRKMKHPVSLGTVMPPGVWRSYAWPWCLATNLNWDVDN